MININQSNKHNRNSLNNLIDEIFDSSIILSLTTFFCLLQQKIYCNRTINSAAFCTLQRMSLPNISFYAAQIISPFLTSKISTNHDKGLEF